MFWLKITQGLLIQVLWLKITQGILIRVEVYAKYHTCTSEPAQIRGFII